MENCCGSARCSAIHSNRGWSSKRCCSSTLPCSAQEMAISNNDRFNGGSTVSRPGVLSLNIREKAALYAAYMPFLKGGGIFIPTNRPYQLGEEVFMLLSLMDDPQRIAVQGKVVWITPDGVQGNRTQGIGVQFTNDDIGASARAQIEQVLGETLASNRPTHTM